ncbi:MAG: pyrroline-5-carboxylate reductase [Bacilli bacterium]
MMKLGFLGMGKMGSAILSGVLKQQLFLKSDIYYFDPYQDIDTIYRVDSERTLYDLVDVVILAIKPQLFPTVIPLLLTSLRTPLMISIAGGIDLEYLNYHFPHSKIIRVMPNLAATINECVSVYSINNRVKADDETLLVHIFSSLGTVYPINEQQMDGVVALNGSYPAYLYFFIQAMISAAVKDGFCEEFAKKIVCETARASVDLAMQDKRSLSDLIRDICSPKGITLEGIQVMEDGHLRKLVEDVYQATKKRSIVIKDSYKSH